VWITNLLLSSAAKLLLFLGTSVLSLYPDRRRAIAFVFVILLGVVAGCSSDPPTNVPQLEHVTSIAKDKQPRRLKKLGYAEDIVQLAPGKIPSKNP
jgi:hypothetical protein